MRTCTGVRGEGCGRLVERGRCPEHARAYEAQRHGREIYGGDWPAISRAMRSAEAWCHATVHTARCHETDLTVDHPTGLVLSRSCHAALEAQRRRELRNEVKCRHR